MSKRKTKIIEDLVTQDEIVNQFKAIESKSDKIAWLRKMDGTTPHIITAGPIGEQVEKKLADLSGTKEVEEKVSVKKVTKKKKEEDGEDSWAKSYVDPVGETDAEKPLTRQELDALL